jgi:hypothetical protein
MFIEGCQFDQRFPYENVEALARQSLAFAFCNVPILKHLPPAVALPAASFINVGYRGRRPHRSPACVPSGL